MLVMLAGLPGVGKSHLADVLARRIGAAVVSVDPIEDAMLRSGLEASFETGLAAYNVGATVAAAQLRNGLSVIADAANYLEVGRDIWRHAAASCGSPIRAIEVVCSDEGLHRSRVESRQRGLDHFPEPTWADVQRRRSEREAWTSEVLVVDSVLPLDDLLKLALKHVGS